MPAIKEVQQQTGENTDQSSLNERAAGNNTVYLRVTIEPVNSLGSSEILSDGGDYVHGLQQVEAQILSSDGNFYMNTNSNTAKATIRRLVFENTDRFLPYVMNGLPNYSLRTTIADGATPIQNMVVGGTPQLVGFRVWGVKLKGVVDWRLVYKNGYESDYWNSSSTTDYAKVTRISETQWTIEPAGPGNSALYPGNASSTADKIADYVVPFKLTLRRK